MLTKFRTGALAVVLTTTFPMAASATNGLQLLGYGAKSQGMGGASLAFPQDAQAAANNPAGLSRIGTRLDAELTILSADTSYSAGPFNFEADPTVYIPGDGFSYELSDRLTLGVSLFSYGLSVDWEEPVNAATSDTSSTLATAILSPALSYTIAPGHSIGVGLRLALQEIDQEGFQPVLATDPGGSTATGVGFTLGYLGNLTPDLTLGLTYMSEIDMGSHDDYDVLIAGGDSVNIPEQYGIGLAWQASDRLVIAADYLRINWGDVDAFGTTLNPPPSDSGFGWDNQDVYRLGLAYQANDAWTFRAGVTTSNQLVDSGSVALSYAAPAVVTDHATFGFTYAPDERNEFSLAIARSLEESLDGDGLSAGTSAETAIWAINFGYGRKF